MTFADTAGEPILSCLPDDGGWILHVQYYRPFRTGVAEFDEGDAALSAAQKLLQRPLADTYLLEAGRVNLLSDRRRHPDGNSYFLNASLRQDGSLKISGQDLGPTIGIDGEYEYWYTIKAENVPALVAALGGTPGQDILDFLVQRWSGEAAYRLGPAIRNSGVEYAFANYC